MNEGVIGIWVRNSLEHIKIAVECLRYYSGFNNYKIVLLVDQKVLGLDVWAMEQNIACLYMNERKASAGVLMNQLLDMNENRNVIFMDDSCMVVQGTIPRLLEGLEEEPNVGAVGPMSNAFEHYQWNDQYMNYEMALNNAKGLEKRTKEVLALGPHFFMLSSEAICEIGQFDESIVDILYIVQDYFLRMILAGWKIKVCEGSFVWSLGVKKSKNSIDEKRMEEKWGMHYFNTMYNFNLLKLIEEDRDNCFKVLEIGCDCGATLLEIKNRYPNAKVYGSEINENAVKIASCVATVSVDNIENFDLGYGAGFFDYIIFGDVLEHLRNPLEVIKYCRNLLNENGCILASIPNLMHISVISQLLNGRFTYTESGLLDKTHIHFFTYDEMVKMFYDAQYQVESVLLVGGEVGEANRQLIDNLLKLGEAKDFMYSTFQYAVRARK